jgi:chromate transporter
MDEDTGNPLWLLITHLAILSFAAVGGGVIMLAPDIHRYVVDVHPWVTDEQFAAAYAIAQAAPGPNMLFVTLVGWQIAGWVGAIGATGAVVIPPALLTFIATRVSSRRGGSVGRFGKAVRDGLAPLSIGMLIAGGWVLFDSGSNGWREAVAVALTLIVVLRTKINPLWLIITGALAGIAGLVG